MRAYQISANRNLVSVKSHGLFSVGPLELPYCLTVFDAVQAYLLLARNLGGGEGRDEIAVQPAFETFVVVDLDGSLQIERLTKMNVITLETVEPNCF